MTLSVVPQNRTPQQERANRRGRRPGAPSRVKNLHELTVVHDSVRALHEAPAKSLQNYGNDGRTRMSVSTRAPNLPCVVEKTDSRAGCPYGLQFNSRFSILYKTLPHFAIPRRQSSHFVCESYNKQSTEFCGIFINIKSKSYSLFHLRTLADT